MDNQTKPNNLSIIRSYSHDPWHNLALEELLLNQIQPGHIILYLWQNQNTVVIGRNQNPWRECRCKLLESEGGKLARRLSGGGAVYHDLGNLNFTFISDLKLFNKQQQFQIILQAVEKLGIKAEFVGRNDLLVQGKKFSGNAYYQTSRGAYHHGTILVNADLSRVARYLQVSQAKMAARGVKSVQARVTNLVDIKEGITANAVIQSLITCFPSFYHTTAPQWTADDYVKQHQSVANLEQLYQKYAGWHWRYGQTPDFNVVYENKFNWGEIEIKLMVKDGQIHSATIYSDALEADLMQKIAAILPGLPLQKKYLLQGLTPMPSTKGEQVVINDLQQWFSILFN